MDSGIYHVTTTGNTEPAAEGVKDLMVRSLKTENRSLSLPSTDVADSSSLPDPQPGDTIGIHEIGEADLSDLITHDGLIVGFLTWHTGADTERSGTVICRHKPNGHGNRWEKNGGLTNLHVTLNKNSDAGVRKHKTQRPKYHAQQRICPSNK